MLRSVARLLAATLLLVSLAAVSAAPVGAGGGCHGNDGTAHSEGDATVVRMGSCSFSPTVVHVPVGTQVRFTEHRRGRPPGRRRGAILGHVRRGLAGQGDEPGLHREGRLPVQLPAASGDGRGGRRRWRGRGRGAAGRRGRWIHERRSAGGRGGSGPGGDRRIVGTRSRGRRPRRDRARPRAHRRGAACGAAMAPARRRPRRPDPDQARATPGSPDSTRPTRHESTPAAARSACTRIDRAGVDRRQQAARWSAGRGRARRARRRDAVGDRQRRRREPAVVRRPRRSRRPPARGRARRPRAGSAAASNTSRAPEARAISRP